MKSFTRNGLLMAAVTILSFLALPVTAHARDWHGRQGGGWHHGTGFSLSFYQSGPAYYRPYYYVPQPVYYVPQPVYYSAPQPVYYMPQPVYYAPAPMSYVPVSYVGVGFSGR